MEKQFNWLLGRALGFAAASKTILRQNLWLMLLLLGWVSTAQAVILPSPPTNVTATASDGNATVAFTPGSIGSGTLVNYTVRFILGCYEFDPVLPQCFGPSISVGGSPTTVSGLTNGTEYSFQVQTVSTAGVSDWSSSNWVTPATPGTFALTGSMQTARYLHSGTLLPNGKVLIAGGVNGSSVLATAELYDPATGTFTPTGSMGTARSEHSGTLLPNGTVLIAGGVNDSSFLATAELYDPATGTFTPTWSMGEAHSRHTGILLPSGNVLIAGDAYIDSAELYDPASGIFMPTGSIGTYSQPTVTLLYNGKVLIAGGYSWACIHCYNNSARLYDSASGAFTPTGSMGWVRDQHMGVLLPNGNVLVAGGYGGGGYYIATAELYDPASGTFTWTGSMGTARSLATGMLLPTGKVLIAGGYNGSSLATAELYDPASGIFTPTGSMGTARSRHAGTLLPTGEVLITGGYNGAALATAELYSHIISMPAVEFYKADINHYFMTASMDEAAFLDNKPEWNWARTGKTFNIWQTQSSAPSNASPVCRFYGVFANGTVGSHFYTVDTAECEYVKGRLDWGWGYEGDAFYAVKPTGGSCPSGTSPVYRAYNNGMGGAPNHRYMTSQAEVDTMVSQGWVSEGTAFCGAQ